MAGDGACCAALCTLHRDARTTRTVFEVPADHRQVRGHLHPQVSGHSHGRGEIPKREITSVFTSELSEMSEMTTFCWLIFFQHLFFFQVQRYFPFQEFI